MKSRVKLCLGCRYFQVECSSFFEQQNAEVLLLNQLQVAMHAFASIYQNYTLTWSHLCRAHLAVCLSNRLKCCSYFTCLLGPQAKGMLFIYYFMVAWKWAVWLLVTVGVYWAHVYRGPSRGSCIGSIYTHPSRVGGIEELFPSLWYH